MENHLLRHGDAMEAELKAMGAVQLGVRIGRKRRQRERESDDETNRSGIDDANEQTQKSSCFAASESSLLLLLSPLKRAL